MCTHQKQHTQSTKIANRAGGGSRVYVAVTEKQACDASNAPRAARPAPPGRGSAAVGRRAVESLHVGPARVGPTWQ